MSAAALIAPAPADVVCAVDEAWALTQRTTGFLTEKEARFLALAAAVTPARGVVLEIGSFKGRSTVGLASVARRFALGSVVAVDPFTAPSRTDPDLAGQATSFDDFTATLRGAGLLEQVEVHRAYSHQLVREWSRPIRLLWIDGDHTYDGARLDVTGFAPHVAPFGIVAIHDALHHFDGPLRVYVEEILASDDFGPVGFCGSIAWAQYRPNGGGLPWRRARQRLARRARPLVAMFDRRERITGFRTHLYRFHRSRVPHGAMDPARFTRMVWGGM